MSENRNDVPGDSAKDPLAQPWGRTPGNAADADSPTQPLNGSHSSDASPDAMSERNPDAAPDAAAPDAASSEAGQDSAPGAARQPEPQYSPSAGQGPWGQPDQGQQPNKSQYQGQPQAGQPNYGAGYGVPPSPYGYPGNYQAPAPQPGKTMGIVGLILSCLFFIPFASLVGVILSIVAFVQSRKARMSNGPALAGIIIGAVVFLLTLLATIAIFVFAVDTASTFYEVCSERGPGTYFVDGEMIECGSFDDLEQSL